MAARKSAKNKLRRGFLKEANEYAVEYRSELGLRSCAPLCPFVLADHLAIPVTPLSDYEEMPRKVVEHFRGIGLREFSAITIKPSGFPEIIFNDACHPNRQNSSVAHEIAHIVLGHELRLQIINGGCRDFDPMLEKEANEFAYAILISPDAALRSVEDFRTLAEAANHYGVSEQLLQHRIGKTNARKWAENRRKR